MFAALISHLNRMNIRLVQHLDEFEILFNSVFAICPKVFVEIGSFQGASAFVLAHACSIDAKVICIDNGTEGRKGEKKIKALESTINNLRNIGYDAHMVIGNSEDKKTIAIVKELLNGQQIDFLHIDGGHKYHQSESDYMNYSPMVRRGGLVAIHDINSRCGKRIETPRFWQKLRTDINLKTDEIMLNVRDGGVGLVFK